MEKIFSTAYMPPLAMWLALKDEESFCLCSNERYEKQTFRNRAFIITSQGEQRLTVPVSCPQGPLTPIKEVLICYNKDWPRDHWRSLCTAYNNSPYFLYYKDDIEVILKKRHETLWDLNLDMLRFLLKAFRWNKPIIEADFVEDKKCIIGACTDNACTSEAGACTEKAGACINKTYENTFLLNIPPDRLGNISVCDYLFNCGATL